MFSECFRSKHSKVFQREKGLMTIFYAKHLCFRWPVNFVLLAVILSFNISAQEKLVLVGGGERSPQVVSQFVEWAGKEKARILIITWASGIPQESFDSLKEDFKTFPTASFEPAPLAPLDADQRARFLDQLKGATGVFFAGGDQNRIMDVLKDESLLSALRERYNAGVVFGGTSAGTALMSTPMMTGEGDLKLIDGAQVGVRPGLGLLPNVILDQHFIVRQRENRLFGLVLQNRSLLGVGIDENTALLVKDNRFAEVVGATYVMFVDGKSKKATFVIYLLKAGERFDLVKRKVISKK
jgi:cyanophycinase